MKIDPILRLSDIITHTPKMTTSNIQVTKYLSKRFNFEMTDNTSKNIILPNKRPITVAEVEAEDEAELVKKWGRALSIEKNERQLRELHAQKIAHHRS